MYAYIFCLFFAVVLFAVLFYRILLLLYFPAVHFHCSSVFNTLQLMLVIAVVLVVVMAVELFVNVLKVSYLFHCCQKTKPNNPIINHILTTTMHAY